MPSVLMVGYWYPPAPGAAANRLHGFAQHLPAYGWQPLLLTSGDAAPTDPPTTLRVADIGAASTARFPDYVWPEAPARRRSILRSMIFPDRFFIWRRRARRAARRYLREHSSQPPAAVWATFPPASAAALGADLAATLRLPLVLDFRDLWLGPGGYSPPTRLHHWLHERLERRVIRRAAALVTVSDAMSDFLDARHSVPRERIITIPNGFDAHTSPLSNLSPASSTLSPFVLAHIGTVIPRNRPDLFFQALATAPHRDRWRAEGLRIRFVGNLSPAVTQRPEFAGLVETTGLVPPAEAWRETQTASALLLLVGDYVARWGHNAKLFDYLRAGRPILCLEQSPGSNDRKLLESLAPQRCIFSPLTDVQATAAAIDEIRRLAARLGPDPLAPPPGLERYDRAVLARDLANILERVAPAPA